MNLHACPFLPCRALTGTWQRALHARHISTPLATSHTRTLPGRFNPGTTTDPAFEILYLATNALVAQFEVQALLGSPYPGATFVPNPSGSWVIVAVDVHLQSVVDLALRSRRRLLRTTVQELTGDWRGYMLRKPTRPRGGKNGSDIPTHRLGMALEHVSSVEGFLCHSARISTHANLMVFPQKLQKGSWIECVNPVSGKKDRIAP